MYFVDPYAIYNVNGKEQQQKLIQNSYLRDKLTTEEEIKAYE